MDSTLIDDVLRVARRDSELGSGLKLDRLTDRPVLPGMVFTINSPIASVSSWSFGPGLSGVPQPYDKRTSKPSICVIVSQFGILKHSVDETGEPVATSFGNTGRSGAAAVKHHLWVERPTHLYAPRSLTPISRSAFRCTVSQLQVGDRVVGVVLRRAGDIYVVDIGCPSGAILNFLAFEGASKKNRPDIGSGDVIYAVITQADRDLDIELSCTDETGRASGMGILGRYEPGTVGNAGGMAGGVMLHCSPDLIRHLANSEQFPLLNILAKTFPFEVVLGANGKIWLTARTSKETMLIANAIALADHVGPTESCQFAATLCG